VPCIPGEFHTPLELVRTGITGLDLLLSGGFIKGSTVLVSGNYGVGKTLFALQYAFHQASRGEKVLYVSTSEPVFKVKQFASNLEFYDDRVVHTGYKEFSHKKNTQHAGSVEFIESSLGIITGLHFTDESSLIEEIRNMVEGKGIQHLIIDPITTITMLYESETAMRKDILLLGAWLTRLGCTVLLTAEETDPRLLEVEKYLADCVINLNSRQQGHEREFYVSVQKLRGNRQAMSSQLYTLGRDGVTIIPDLSVAGRHSPPCGVKTGIPALDRIAQIAYGSSWLISVDDRSDYLPVIESMLAEALAAGDGIVYSPPARLSFDGMEAGLKRFGVDLPGACAACAAYFVDNYGRKAPEHLRPYVVENYPEVEDMLVLTGRSRDRDRRWRTVADLGGERYLYGAEALHRRFTAGQSRAREGGDIYLAYCNFRELDPDLAEYLKASCDGIIEVYTRGGYQFLRVARSPSAISGEYVMVPSQDKPYVRLVQK
jgi:KaiC/GvpD/RAD55 family RecA-like ATPase